MPIHILKILPPKNENFQIKKKNLLFFLTSTQNIDCVYSLEPPQRGCSRLVAGWVTAVLDFVEDPANA